MITFENITKTYGGTTVLNIPSLQIESGQTIGLVGNNGAGKTTMFSVLLDLIRTTTGTVTLKGEDVSKTEYWKAFTGSYLDENYLIGYLKPEEYFYFVGDLYNWNKAQVDTFLEQFTEIFSGEILGKAKYIRDLSKGNQKKVGIIAALIGDPDIIILDEPFANLDPTTQFRLQELIRTLPEDKTILISSHDLNHVAEVCDRILIMEKGELVRDTMKSENTLEELRTFFAVSAG